MSTLLRAVSTGDPPRLPGLSAAMLTELDAVQDDRSFDREPDLSVLLRYLVDVTLAGHDDRLTPCSIAEEIGGVGVFDRAFIGAAHCPLDRLRAALERHYAHCDPAGGLCLMLTEGSYRVWLVRPEVAYPRLFRRSGMVEWPLVSNARRVRMELVGA